MNKVGRYFERYGARNMDKKTKAKDILIKINKKCTWDGYNMRRTDNRLTKQMEPIVNRKIRKMPEQEGNHGKL